MKKGKSPSGTQKFQGGHYVGDVKAGEEHTPSTQMPRFEDKKKSKGKKGMGQYNREY